MIASFLDLSFPSLASLFAKMKLWGDEVGHQGRLLFLAVGLMCFSLMTAGNIWVLHTSPGGSPSLTGEVGGENIKVGVRPVLPQRGVNAGTRFHHLHLHAMSAAGLEVEIRGEERRRGASS